MKKNFWKRLEYVKAKDIRSAFVMVAAIPYAVFLKIRRKNMWLICEEAMEARDNGFWFYSYVCGEHPEQDVVYAIDKKSVDYKKVASLGQVIPYGGYRHWAYYMAAAKNISTQKGGKPNPAICYILEVYLGLGKRKRIFLQHGITYNLLDWLFYKNTKMRMFICGARPEYEYVKKRYGYPNGYVKYTGFARFDGLHHIQVKKNQILVMPTWREWIAHPSSTSKNYDDISDFTKTEYYQKWSQFLQDPGIHKVLEENGMHLIFFPHRNMQPYLEHFHTDGKAITIASWKKYDVQQLLKESAFLITDYSSIFMDFAYMKKPMLYYQFDYKKFYEAQYAEGYFNCKENGFGPVCQTLEEVREQLADAIGRGLQNLPLYEERESKFFPLWDDQNCRRIYESIKEIEK